MQICFLSSLEGGACVLFIDDLWIVSRHLDFRPSSTILCKSTYYGPTSANEVEIEPIAKFSPSNWSNEGKNTRTHF